ncbi:hypothetical protein GJV85_12550 [Sulfurimonas aquatica]|uniref:Uncharacterized protein n=1 Tax=Sulfurimonas aquatica TaxID=2672570 RepID=A0A975B283_9BACT|nr:hypothetical protein [Sulfurimonas aquatica]QSZ42902.1 hypothetical protein GJV85_12550 [Sulfurimonas aquatica]
MLKLNIREFIKYKLLNSLFLGISVGSIFILYAPLQPSIYSMGGILLALAMLVVAKFYYKIMNIEYFFKISLTVELTLLFVITLFLLFAYSYTTALIIYIGYQITFTFGSYLIRAETLFLKHSKPLELVDVAKQKGYLLGMLLSYIFYRFLELGFGIDNKQTEVYLIHFLLLLNQVSIIFYLFKSFKRIK